MPPSTSQGKLLSRQEVVTRTRSYSVLGDVKVGPGGARGEEAYRPVPRYGSGTAVAAAGAKQVRA